MFAFNEDIIAFIKIEFCGHITVYSHRFYIPNHQFLKHLIYLSVT